VISINSETRTSTVGQPQLLFFFLCGGVVCDGVVVIVLAPDLQPNQEMVTTPDLSSLSSPLIDTERNLGLLLGLHASFLAMSTPLSSIEKQCASKTSSRHPHTSWGAYN